MRSVLGIDGRQMMDLLIDLIGPLLSFLAVLLAFWVQNRKDEQLRAERNGQLLGEARVLIEELHPARLREASSYETPAERWIRLHAARREINVKLAGRIHKDNHAQSLAWVARTALLDCFRSAEMAITIWTSSGAALAVEYEAAAQSDYIVAKDALDAWSAKIL